MIAPTTLSEADVCALRTGEFPPNVSTLIRRAVFASLRSVHGWNEFDAQDMCQDVSLRLWRSCAQFACARELAGAVYCWSRQVVISWVRSACRQQRVLTGVSLDRLPARPAVRFDWAGFEQRCYAVLPPHLAGSAVAVAAGKTKEDAAHIIGGSKRKIYDHLQRMRSRLDSAEARGELTGFAAEARVQRVLGRGFAQRPWAIQQPHTQRVHQ